MLFTVILSIFLIPHSIDVQASQKKDSYITNKKFKGTFEYKEEKGIGKKVGIVLLSIKLPRME